MFSVRAISPAADIQVTMLGKALDSKKWIALVMLMAGVALVQVP